MTDSAAPSEWQPNHSTASPEPPLLEARHVSRVFEDVHVTAVDDVSLRVQAGEYVSLMGKSGSGKSTLLNLLGGLDRPSKGDILFRGVSLKAMGDLAEFRARQLGFVFQSFHLVSVLTASQNVQLPLMETMPGARERTERAAALLDRVGMGHRVNHRASRLSGGERQRVAVARALASDPSLILADEPTGNLDTKTAGEIIELFAQLDHDGKTIVMVTHDAQLAACARRTLTLSDGRLVAS